MSFLCAALVYVVAVNAVVWVARFCGRRLARASRPVRDALALAALAALALAAVFVREVIWPNT